MLNIQTQAWLCAAIILATSSWVVAQVENGTCDHAQEIVEDVYAWSSDSDTNQMLECRPTHGDVFFDFTAPVAAGYEFVVIGMTRAIVISLHPPGCSAPEDECVQSGVGPGGGARLSRYLEAGERIVVRVGVFGTDTSSTQGFLAVHNNLAVSNDQCENALDVALGTTDFDSTGALNHSESTCGGLYDVFFRFTPIQSGRYTIHTCGSFFNQLVSVSSSCHGDAIACNNHPISCAPPPLNVFPGAVQVDVSGGSTLYIRVAGRVVIDRGHGNINISLQQASSSPTNETCQAAAMIATNQIISIPSLGVVIPDMHASCSDSLSIPDMWFSYTPAFSGHARVDTCGSEVDTFLSVHSGCNGVVLACNDDACSPKSSEIIVPVTSGTNYRIRLGVLTPATSGTARLRVTQAEAPPSNDRCETPISLTTGQPVSGDTRYANSELPLLPGWDYVKDIWYYYVPPKEGTVTIELQAFGENGIQSPFLGIFNSCNSFRYIFLPNLVNGISSTSFHVSASEQIRVRLGNTLSGKAGEFSLSLEFAPLHLCPADFNDVNGVTVQDIFDFLTAWLAGNASADFNDVNGVTVQDIFDFLTAWLAGC